MFYGFFGSPATAEALSVYERDGLQAFTPALSDTLFRLRAPLTSSTSINALGDYNLDPWSGV